MWSRSTLPATREWLLDPDLDDLAVRLRAGRGRTGGTTAVQVDFAIDLDTSATGRMLPTRSGSAYGPEGSVVTDFQGVVVDRRREARRGRPSSSPNSATVRTSTVPVPDVRSDVLRQPSGGRR